MLLLTPRDSRPGGPTAYADQHVSPKSDLNTHRGAVSGGGMTPGQN